MSHCSVEHTSNDIAKILLDLIYENEFSRILFCPMDHCISKLIEKKIDKVQNEVVKEIE